MPSRIDVVVVTHNSAPHVAAAIRSLRSCARVERIVVVDNASHDATVREVERAGADEVLVNTENVGFARGVNRALGLVETDRLLLINPDARIDETALTALDAALDATPRAAIASPALVADDGLVTLGASRFSTLTTRLGMCLPLVGRLPIFRCERRPSERLLRPGAITPVEYLWGAVMLLDAAFLRLIGGFDERFFLFYEDEDLCRQARAHGRTAVLVGGAYAHHVGGASSSDAALREARRLFAAWQLMDKWEGGARADIYGSGAVAAFRLREAALRTVVLASSRTGPTATTARLAARASEVRRTIGLFQGMLAQGRAL